MGAPRPASGRRRGERNKLVTYPQLGHSYAINPGSPASGSMRTTSSIAAPHREHASALPRLLLDRFDTIPAPCVRALLSCVSPLLPTHDPPVGFGTMTSDPCRQRSPNRWTPPFRDRVGNRVGRRPPSPRRYLEIYPPAPHIWIGGNLSANQVGHCADCGKTPEDQGRNPTVDYRRASHLRGMRERMGHYRRPCRRRSRHRYVDGVPLPSRPVGRLCL